ncbi:MAG: hypothetical protein ACM3ML_29840 [Micromonosporaceae bacterium]
MSFVPADLTETGAAETLVETIEWQRGGSDLLVSNAGGDPLQEFHTMTIGCRPRRKDGIIGFTRVLRSDYHERGVSASVLILGPIRGAGQRQRMLDESGRKAPVFMAPAASVARAAVRAVKKDRIELVVMPGPGRLMRAITDYFPGLGPAVNRAAGATTTMQKIIQLREAKTDAVAFKGARSAVLAPGAPLGAADWGQPDPAILSQMTDKYFGSCR